MTTYIKHRCKDYIVYTEKSDGHVSGSLAEAKAYSRDNVRSPARTKTAEYTLPIARTAKAKTTRARAKRTAPVVQAESTSEESKE